MVGAVGLMQPKLRLVRKWLVGKQDGSKPQCLARLGSFIEGGCAEDNIDVYVLDHEHLGFCEDVCVAGITVLAHREERHLQVRDAMTFSS